MFEEIFVIVLFLLVKECFVLFIYFNVKKKNVLFCFEGYSILFLYLRFIVWLLIILWLLYYIIILYICKIYIKFCNYIGLNMWSMYWVLDEIVLFYVYGLLWYDILILIYLVKKKMKIRVKNYLNVKKK